MLRQNPPIDLHGKASVALGDARIGLRFNASITFDLLSGPLTPVISI
jgi:hypothetical protein